EGPSTRALVPAPLYVGMKEGAVVRFEEVTRCPLEIQDSLLAALSDRVLAIPEMEGEGNMLFAKDGFNVIATANTRDLGVNEMSAALKRRFNFETVFPIGDFKVEMDLVRDETSRLLARSGVPSRRSASSAPAKPSTAKRWTASRPRCPRPKPSPSRTRSASAATTSAK